MCEKWTMKNQENTYKSRVFKNLDVYFVGRIQYVVTECARDKVNKC